MEEFINNLKWQDVVTALSIVFGLITLIAYLDQRKSNKDQKKYLEFVNRQLDRDITKEEVDDLKNKKSELRNDIEQKLPQIGRSAVLQDQAEFYQKGIYNNYQALQEVNSKLTELGDVNIEEVNPDLKDYILKEVSPKYRFEKLITRTRDRVLGLLALIIVIGTVLPFEIDYYIQLVLGVYMIGEILKYMVLNANSEEDRIKIYKNGIGLIILAGLGLIAFSAVIVIQDWEDYKEKFDLVLLVWGTIALIGMLLVIFANRMINGVRKRIEKEMN